MSREIFSDAAPATRQTSPKDVCSVSHLVSGAAADTSCDNCSCSPSSSGSQSSCSLEQRVTSESQKHVLIEKVKSLQSGAMALSERISGGRVNVTQVQSALDKMLQEHSHLATAVAETAVSLEVVNLQSKGRAAIHIASSRASLGLELRVLAQHLSSLEKSLRHKSNNLSTSPAATHQNIEDIDRGSPHLPDIYLTPSRPTHSTSSPLSDPTQQSCDSSSHSPSSPPSLSSPESHAPLSPPEAYSPPSSLSCLHDPFTPEANSASPSRDHSGVLRVDSGVPPLPLLADSGAAATKTWTHKSEDVTRETWNATNVGQGVGGVCPASGEVNTGRNPAVMQWLLTSGSTRDYGGNADTATGRRGWRREEEEIGSPPDLSCHSDTYDCRGDTDGCHGNTDGCDDVAVSTTPPRGGGERVVSPTVLSSAGSPLSPPVSSPCADSGISCSNYSHLLPTAPHHFSLHRSAETLPHSLLSTSPPDHTTQPSSSTATITMSEIAALRSELARLREEIMNHSNWSHSLDQDHSCLGPDSIPSHGSIPCSASSSYTPSVPIPNHTQTPFHTPVSRPYRSTVSRPFHHTSETPTGYHHLSRSATSSSSKRLFSTPHNSVSRDWETSARSMAQPWSVDRMVQTTPTFEPTQPTTHSSSSVENRTGVFASHQYSPSRPTLRLPHNLSLPPHFTPYLMVHHSTHHPSHTTHHPSHSTHHPSHPHVWSFKKMSSLSRSAGEH